MKILLGRDAVHPSLSDDDGGTPLFWASYNRHNEVVKILFQQDDTHPSKPDDDGGRPLFWIAYKRYERVVKILLGLDNINLSKSDDDGETQLFSASNNGQEGIVNYTMEITSTPTNQKMINKLHSGGLLIIDTRKSGKFYLDELMSTPTNQIATAAHCLDGVPTEHIWEW